jgi:N-acetylglucosaminyldiphosphoundecaprenol N-acetyl-beta-D-mannosaminyltransferase
MIVPRVNILGVGISAITFNEAVKTILHWADSAQRHYVNLCTTHTVLECNNAPELNRIVNFGSLTFPDGMPLVWLGRSHGYSIERVYGPDLMLAVCDRGQVQGVKHFFYGGQSGVPELLAQKLRERFPHIQIVGCYSPPFRKLTTVEEEEIVAMLNASNADIIWVGIGTPRQDYFVGEFRARLTSSVLIPVGAAFDFHAGIKRQAPRWMMNIGLEWLFRMLSEPRRLGKRYLVSNPTFIWKVLMQALGIVKYTLPNR